MKNNPSLQNYLEDSVRKGRFIKLPEHCRSGPLYSQYLGGVQILMKRAVFLAVMMADICGKIGSKREQLRAINSCGSGMQGGQTADGKRYQERYFLHGNTLLLRKSSFEDPSA